MMEKYINCEEYNVIFQKTKKGFRFLIAFTFYENEETSDYLNVFVSGKFSDDENNKYFIDDDSASTVHTVVLKSALSEVEYCRQQIFETNNHPDYLEQFKNHGYCRYTEHSYIQNKALKDIGYRKREIKAI